MDGVSRSVARALVMRRCRIRIVNRAPQAFATKTGTSCKRRRPGSGNNSGRRVAIHCPYNRHAVRQEYSTSNDIDQLYFDTSEKNSAHTQRKQSTMKESKCEGTQKVLHTDSPTTNMQRMLLHARMAINERNILLLGRLQLNPAGKNQRRQLSRIHLLVSRDEPTREWEGVPSKTM